MYNDINTFKINNDLNISNYSQMLWHFINNKNSYILCDNCNKEKVKWISFKKGYSIHCSMKCLNSSEKIKKKIRKSNLERHGHVNAAHGKDAKNKVVETNLKRYGFKLASKNKGVKSKTVKTCLERYGVDNVMRTQAVKDKIKNTCLERYGVDNVFKYNICRNKISETNLERYGHINAAHGKDAKEKIKNTYLKKYKADHYAKSNLFKIRTFNKQIKSLVYLGIKKENILNIQEEYVTIKCSKCLKTYVSKIGFIKQRIKYTKNNPCIKCVPIYSINNYYKELELLEFIKDNYKGKIITSDRTVLKPLELDIYLPDLKLAFEFNGTYWHSDIFKSKNYHKLKTDRCLKLGITLMHIYENLWDTKQDIIKSLIFKSLKINKPINEEFKISRVSLKDSNFFIANNSIKDHIKADVRFGLYYKNVLVSLITLIEKEFHYQLNICDVINMNIEKGKKELFEEIKRYCGEKDIITYIDRSYSNGNIFENFGFNRDFINDPQEIITDKYKIYNSGNIVFRLKG